MHKFLVVAGVVALALVLEGCGGSKGGSAPCSNSDFQIVSQSYTATTTGKMDVKFSNATAPTMPPMPPLDSKSTMKIDVEQMKLYEKFSQDDMHVQVIFNAAKKQLVAKYDVAIPLPNGTTMKKSNCTAITIPMLPEPSFLAKCFKEAVSALGKMLKCTGNDGTYDTWEMSMTLPDPSIPLPLPAGTTEKLQESIIVNKDHLLHAVTAKTNAQVDIPGQGTMTETMDMSMEVDGGVATAGGPSAADLDYSSWGRCYDVPFKPPHFQSLMSFFKAGDESHASGRSHSFRLALKALEGCIPSSFPPSAVVV